MERLSRDDMLMGITTLVAQRGTCSRLQVGAIFSRDGRIISTGYNGAPAGIEHCFHETWEPGLGMEPPERIAEWIRINQAKWDDWNCDQDRDPLRIFTNLTFTSGEPVNPARFMAPGLTWYYNSGDMQVAINSHHPEIPCTRSEHAERNAIAFAAKHGLALENSELHVTHMPCKPCSMAIINAGVIKVTYQLPYRITDGVELMREAGLEVVDYSAREV